MGFGLLLGCLGTMVTMFLFYYHRLYWPWSFLEALFFLISAYGGILYYVRFIWLDAVCLFDDLDEY